MPWNGTTLYLAELDDQGSLIDARIIAGGVAESVFQPEWSPDGERVFFVSDRSNWSRDCGAIFGVDPGTVQRISRPFVEGTAS